MAELGDPVLAAPEVKERMIPGAAGAPQIRIYVTGAAPGASKPAVLHIHRGGYITQTAAGARRDMQSIVLEHDCVAVSVDYRLERETPFPGGLEDNYAALSWIFNMPLNSASTPSESP